MTISLPQRKNRQSDTECPGPQKQNESLVERNKSISRPMQFKQTSSPTGSFALSLSSEAINSKFKQVPKSLAVRLLNCSYSGHSFNSRSLDWWIQEMKYNCSRKIYTPQPNVISTDSSDFAWGAIQNQVKVQGLWRESWAGTST